MQGCLPRQSFSDSSSIRWKIASRKLNFRAGTFSKQIVWVEYLQMCWPGLLYIYTIYIGYKIMICSSSEWMMYFYGRIESSLPKLWSPFRRKLRLPLNTRINLKINRNLKKHWGESCLIQDSRYLNSEKSKSRAIENKFAQSILLFLVPHDIVEKLSILHVFLTFFQNHFNIENFAQPLQFWCLISSLWRTQQILTHYWFLSWDLFHVKLVRKLGVTSLFPSPAGRLCWVLE